MTKWRKETLKMDANHGWRAAPGHKICVLDRGDLQFEYPQHWHVTAEDNALKVTDKPPPNDDCVLQVSLMRFPPLDAGRPSLELLLQQTLLEHGELPTQDEMHRLPREDVEILWGEYRAMDPKEKREAIWRVALCHAQTMRGHLYAVFTFGFWPEDAARVVPVWQHVLESLIMDRPVADPRKGPVLH